MFNTNKCFMHEMYDESGSSLVSDHILLKTEELLSQRSFLIVLCYCLMPVTLRRVLSCKLLVTFKLISLTLLCEGQRVARITLNTNHVNH